MKLVSDEWIPAGIWALLLLGAFVYIALCALWFVSLGHIRLQKPWSKYLESLENKL